MGEYTGRVGGEQLWVCSQVRMRRLVDGVMALGSVYLLTIVTGCGDNESVGFPTNEKAAGALVSVSRAIASNSRTIHPARIYGPSRLAGVGS